MGLAASKFRLSCVCLQELLKIVSAHTYLSYLLEVGGMLLRDFYPGPVTMARSNKIQVLLSAKLRKVSKIVLISNPYLLFIPYSFLLPILVS